MEYLKVRILLDNEGNDTIKWTIKTILANITPETITKDESNNEITIQVTKHTYYYNNNYIARTLFNTHRHIKYIKIEEIEEPEEVEPYNNIVAICDDCENYITQADDDPVATGDERLICTTCYENNYFTCPNCGDVEPVDNSVYTNDGDNICNACYENDYFTCFNCNEVFPNDDAVEYDCEYYCRDCYDELELDDEGTTDLLRSYHDHSRTFNHILKMENETDDAIDTIGIENETERGTSATTTSRYCEVINSKFNKPETLVHFERDGSLENGVEIITEPMTISYWNAHKDTTFRQLLETCHNLGYQSHNGGRCGLHVHFNKQLFGTEQNEQQKRLNTLYLFFETYKNELIKLSRRERFSYCDFLSNTNNTLHNMKDAKLKNQIAQSTKFIEYQKSNTGHYDAINANASTGKTFEIRIMRGTLKPESFIACVEFIVNLVQCVATEEPETISFSKVVNYKPTLYLKQYIKEREIKANYKKLKDHTKQLDGTIKTINNKIDKMTKSITKDVTKLINERAKSIKNIDNKAFNFEVNNTNVFDNLQKLKNGARYIELLLETQNHLKNAEYWRASDILNFSINGEKTDALGKEVDDIIESKKILNLLGA